MRQWPDLIGQRFGMLVVIGQAESAATGQRRWLCRCDCGKEHILIFDTYIQQKEKPNDHFLLTFP